ncbi:MAG: hypothetical protein HEQ39_16965 [Rhizobacter sp.]
MKIRCFVWCALLAALSACGGGTEAPSAQPHANGGWPQEKEETLPQHTEPASTNKILASVNKGEGAEIALPQLLASGVMASFEFTESAATLPPNASMTDPAGMKPRFGDNAPEIYPRVGLLLEGATKNWIPNPHAEGAVAGAVRPSGGGAMPSGWTLAVNGDASNAMKFSILGHGQTADKVGYVDFRFHGENKNALNYGSDSHLDNLDGAYAISFAPAGTTSAMAVARGQSFSMTMGTQYLPGGYITVKVNRPNGSPAVNLDKVSPELAKTEMQFDYRSGSAVTRPLLLNDNFMIERRYTVQSFTETAPTGAAQYFLEPKLIVRIPNQAKYDFTLRISGVQLEKSATPTSVVTKEFPSGERPAEGLKLTGLTPGRWFVGIQTPGKNFVTQVTVPTSREWIFQWPGAASTEGQFRLQKVVFGQNISDVNPDPRWFPLPPMEGAVTLKPRNNGSSDVNNYLAAQDVRITAPRHRIHGSMLKTRGGRNLVVVGGHYKPYPINFWRVHPNLKGDANTEAALSIIGYTGTAHFEGLLVDVSLAMGADAVGSIPGFGSVGNVNVFQSLLKGMHGMLNHTAAAGTDPPRHADGLHLRTDDPTAGSVGTLRMQDVTVRTAFQALMMTPQSRNNSVEQVELNRVNLRYEGLMLDSNSYLVFLRDEIRQCGEERSVPLVKLEQFFVQERLAEVPLWGIPAKAPIPAERGAVQPTINLAAFDNCKPQRVTGAGGRQFLQFNSTDFDSKIRGSIFVVSTKGEYVPGRRFWDFVTEGDVGAVYIR